MGFGLSMCLDSNCYLMTHLATFSNPSSIKLEQAISGSPNIDVDQATLS
ncbi:unnamed protein product [Acidithrix sp. C25]|nr:unnamed protein product [Acidithrix sp. C25]